jgi:hypothetical protein
MDQRQKDVLNTLKHLNILSNTAKSCMKSSGLGSVNNEYIINVCEHAELVLQNILEEITPDSTIPKQHTPE